VAEGTVTIASSAPGLLDWLDQLAESDFLAAR
jgi:hypothetical protein